MNREAETLHEDFLKTFYRLVYMVKIHQVTNSLLMECIDDFKKVVNRLLMEDDQVIIQVSRGNVILQNEKLIQRREIGKLMCNVLQYFEIRDLQGLCFYHMIREASVEEIIAFCRLLNDSEQHQEPREWFMEQLENLGVVWGEIAHKQDTLLMEHVSESEALDQKKLLKAKAKESYFYALNSIKEVAEKITTQKKVGVRKALRVIQNMVDLVMEDESIVLGLSTIRDYDDYTFTHSINVAILSMCTDFDPILLKVFINMLGIYPIGSFLELDTGELALVMDAGKTTDKTRPVVMLLAPAGNNGYIKIGEADLNERDPDSGAYLRSIVKSLHPSSYGLQPAEFLY